MLTKVIFTSIMIGFGTMDPSGQRSTPVPTVFKETIVLEGKNAMAVCQQMETDFHGGYSVKRGTGSYSTETYDTGKRGYIATVQRESRCSRVD